MVIQPINRPPRYILSHALHLIIEGPAVPAVDVALVLDKQVRRDRMKVARHHTRSHVWDQPAPYFTQNLLAVPAPLFQRNLGSWVVEQFRVLREHRFG